MKPTRGERSQEIEVREKTLRGTTIYSWVSGCNPCVILLWSKVPRMCKWHTTQTQKTVERSGLSLPLTSVTLGRAGTISGVLLTCKMEITRKPSLLSAWAFCKIQIKQYIRNSFAQSTGLQTVTHLSPPPSPLSPLLIAKGYVFMKSADLKTTIIQ